MRKKRSGRGDLVIDITSLLDVVFILLLVVLCSTKVKESQYEEQLEEEAQQQQGMEAAEAAYTAFLNDADSLNQFVLSITVVAPYDENNVVNRHLNVLVDGESRKEYLLQGDQTEEEYGAFEQYLSENIQADDSRPIVISFDKTSEKLLYRDEQAIDAILKRLCDKYDNVYLR